MINVKYEKVLEVTGTSHGCGLELVHEDGFSILKATSNEQTVKVEDTVTYVKGKNFFCFICCTPFSCIFFLQNSVFEKKCGHKIYVTLNLFRATCIYYSHYHFFFLQNSLLELLILSSLLLKKRFLLWSIGSVVNEKKTN